MILDSYNEHYCIKRIQLPRWTVRTDLHETSRKIMISSEVIYCKNNLRNIAVCVFGYPFSFFRV